tara:strand:- start:1215 stop:1640 length:426 start_codon:yes stop_codon:yes gene_type:complete
MQTKLRQSSNHLEKSSERSFGLIMACACLIFSLIIWWKNLGTNWMIGFCSAAVIFFLLAIFWESPLRPLNTLWTKFGNLLHRIISPIIIGIIFFLVITPIGIIMRLMRKDLLNLRINNNASSYWIARNKEIDNHSSMTKQF